MLEVGEYVRFDDGTFDKIVDIRDTLGERKLVCFEKRNTYLSDTSLENMEVKHSKNIIDLIEESDYVNGSKVIDIAQAPVKAVYTEDKKQSGALIPIVNKQIENVVTKEQFAQIEYKIKE